MNILITGGMGFIGARVVSRLKQYGYNVFIADIVDGADFQHDLQNEEIVDSLSKFATENQIDVFCHLAAKVGGGKYLAEKEWEICSHNLTVDVNVLNAFLFTKMSRRFIYCSSSMVYQNGPPKAIESLVDNHEIPPPTNNYGFSKLQGERLTQTLCTKLEKEWVIGRPFNVYGPGESANDEVGYSHVIPDFHKKLKADPSVLEVHGTGEQTRSFTHAEDVARAFAMLCFKDVANKSFNIADTENISINELSVMMGEIMGNVPELKHLEGWKGDTNQRVPVTDLAKNILGWKPKIPFKEGLKQNIDALNGKEDE